MKGLPIWTVTENPTDYPGKFVARLFVGEKATGSIVIAPDLERLRHELLEMGLVCLARHPDDDPVIVETWL